MRTNLEHLVHELTLATQTIQKWYGVAFEGKEDEEWEDCAFCGKYFDGNCRACPIVKYKLGHTDCLDTPYEDWHKKTSSPRFAYTVKTKRAAIKELLFLIKVANHICGLIETELFYIKL